MNISTKALSVVLSLAVAGGSSASPSPNNGLPPHHPPVRGLEQAMHPTLARFSSQFRCPYAKEWLTKGAHRAAIDLGLTTPEKIEALKSSGEDNANRQRTRSLQIASASAEIRGSCSFSSQWSGPSCLEFRGEGWTEESMTERCAAEQDSTVTESEGCPRPTELAGWCVKEASSDSFEATSMMVSAMSDCDGNKMACETFVGGAFEAADGCGGGAPPAMGGEIPSEYASMGPPMRGAGETTCTLAPGAIGAAHQSGFSEGYSTTCPGTPSEESPYMWPMAWSADVDTQSLAYGVDDVVHHNKGRVFYRLDKNWKRSDTLYANGVRRGIGQGPCEEIDEEQSMEGVIACKSDLDVASGDPMETMIHRGSKMYFITWKNSTDVTAGETDPSLIAECNYMDLMVIGNIRPDWFLDDRGDDTDVQYLGNQHVYYASTIPRLVKQWRKKDFASQYFTMSMAGNPPSKNATGDDTINWPLVLNIPGEGFGDDMLQVYQNHSLLNDNDDDIFDLVQNLEASGGSCPLLTSGLGPDGEGSDASFGPPTTDVHVPSNLEVDPNSWFKSVYTFSPVWQPPMKLQPGQDKNDVAVTEAGKVRVESCYDPSSESVRLSVQFKDIEAIPTESGSQLPWMSLGYRIDDVCTMIPKDGSDTKVIMITQSPTENFPKAHVGAMGPGAKRFDQTAFGSIYDSLWPLEDALGYSNVGVAAPMLEGDNIVLGSSSQIIKRSSVDVAPNKSSVTLSFQQKFADKPDVMHLMYAIGASPQIGIHTSRSCFEIVEFPTCLSEPNDFLPPPEEPQTGKTPVMGVSTEESSSSVTSQATFLTVIVAAVGSLFLAF